MPAAGTVVEMDVLIQREVEDSAGKIKQSLIFNVIVHGLRKTLRHKSVSVCRQEPDAHVSSWRTRAAVQL